LAERKKKKQETDENKSRALRFIGDQTQIQRVEGQSTSGGSKSVSRSEFQLAYDRIKIFYGYLQIFSSLSLVFVDCPWPGLLRDFSLSLDFVNINPDFSIAGSCGMAIPYLDQFLVHGFTPIILVALLVLARGVAFVLKKDAESRRAQGEFYIKTRSSLLLMLYPVRTRHQRLLYVSCKMVL
jgi:hypothetical protein